MRILEKIKFLKPKNPALMDYRLQTIRFKKLLENARALLELFDDGNEKLQGEYIFDRQYVVSLIDSAMERVGMIIHDGAILAPERGETLYSLYDKHVLVSRELAESYKKNEQLDAAHGDINSSIMQYPEYRFLSEVLSWLAGDESGTTVKDLMKIIFSDVLRVIDCMDILKDASHAKNLGLRALHDSIYVMDLWSDESLSDGAASSVDDIKCVPLNLLLMDIEGGMSPVAGKVSAWIAAAGEYQLTLNSLDRDFMLRLETNVSGFEKSDFIFVFAGNSVNLKEILPPGFNIEDTGQGVFAWNIKLSSKKIEDDLVFIGRKLFMQK